MKINEYIGLRFRELRLKNGWSLEEVGQRLGMNRYTYYNYEIARRSIPLDEFAKISRFYGLDFGEFCNEIIDKMNKGELE